VKERANARVVSGTTVCVDVENTATKQTYSRRANTIKLELPIGHEAIVALLALKFLFLVLYLSPRPD
jgi:hypothetical protein